MLETEKREVQNEWNSYLRQITYSGKKKGMSEEEKEKRLKKIEQKLKNGKKLTAEEMSFIQQYYPEKYPIIKRIQLMRENLENQLEHACSKQEVQKLYAFAVGMVSDKDPYKEEILNAYQDVLQEFKKSSAYQKLPQKTEEEMAEIFCKTTGTEFEDEVRKEEYQLFMPKFDLHM